MNRDELKVLLKDLRSHEQVVQYLGLLNTVGMSNDERLDLDLKCNMAVIKYRKANLKYQSALNQFIDEKEVKKHGDSAVVSPSGVNMPVTEGEGK